jgi:hypothetical protein
MFYNQKRGGSMTVLIGWIGVDSRGPCSAYLMSDSRISWNDQRGAYDYGRKLFAFKSSPDILGYCGDVTFPSLVLSQLCELADSGLLCLDSESSSQRSQKILKQIAAQYKAYPAHARSYCSIYHISRDLDSSFCAYKYFHDEVSNEWCTEYLATPVEESARIICDGSGASEFKKLYLKYQNGDLANTSRNLFQCFCDSLSTTKIPSCGGPPQLVGLYNGKKFNGLSFGIIYQGSRYFYGSPYLEQGDHETVQWYNENFERCDGRSMEILPNAMRQPNPNRTNLATP